MHALGQRWTAASPAVRNTQLTHLTHTELCAHDHVGQAGAVGPRRLESPQTLFKPPVYRALSGARWLDSGNSCPVPATAAPGRETLPRLNTAPPLSPITQ